MLTLKDRVALVIHFYDSVGEGYAYYDEKYLSGGKIDFDKCEREDYCRELDAKYYEAAGQIIDLIKDSE